MLRDVTTGNTIEFRRMPTSGQMVIRSSSGETVKVVSIDGMVFDSIRRSARTAGREMRRIMRPTLRS